MPKFYVDTESVNARTYEVYADTEEEARERFPDVGIVVSSETTSPAVIKVSNA